MSMNKNGVKKENRIDFISFLQFIGVISVIFGHSMNSIQVPAIFTEIKAWVYTYHMPLFFFVSAFLFAYKGGYDQGYGNVLIKRFWRLIVPYFLWNVLFIFPKIILKEYITDEVQLTPSYFIRIMLRPRDNILGHTWFLFALFEMFIIAIILDKARNKKNLWIPIILGLTVINCFGVTNRWLAVGDLMKNGIFFWCGLLVGSYASEQIEDYLRKKAIIISCFVISIGTTLIWVFNREMNINTLILGFTILILLMSIQIVFNIKGRLISFVSYNSFPIYIMHWPVIMVVRLVFYQKLGLHPVVSMVINLVLGFVIPCLIVLVLRMFKATWIKKICTVLFGM